jgi:two-component system OmpR family response regulator
VVNPPRHILLVEDDPDLLVVLSHVLEQAGYRVTPVARRVDARVALSRGDVDLVVTDSALRGGNGDDIAKAAARDSLPIVMMSGEPDRIARLSGGPLPFLQKPFRSAALVALVEQLLP